MKVFSDWIGSPHEFFDNYVEYSDTELFIVKEFLQKKVWKIINSPDFKIIYKPPHSPINPSNQQEVDTAVRILSTSIRNVSKEDMEEYIDWFVERDPDPCCECAKLDEQDRWDVLEWFFCELINDRLRISQEVGIISKNMPYSFDVSFSTID